jgi:hypothetical protein
MPFESIKEYLPIIDERLAAGQSPNRIARELGLPKSTVYEYKKECFDTKTIAAIGWSEEQRKSHEARLAEGKARIVDSLELLNKAKLRAEFLIDLELNAKYKLADGTEKELSLASAALYWQMGQKMACETIRQEQEILGDDPNSKAVDSFLGLIALAEARPGSQDT